MTLLNTPQWLALLTFLSVMSFTPGPNTLLSSALAANFGLRRTLPFVCAVPVGWALLLSACAAGVGALVSANALLGGLIKYGGIGYMLWLAWRILRATQLADRATELQDKPPVGFTQGVALQFVNIKAWVGAITITSTWITPTAQPTSTLLQLTPVFMAFALASNAAYALAGSALRVWLLQGQRLAVFNAVMAAALAATCVWMLFL